MFIARGITGKFIVFIARGIIIINVHVEKRNHRKIHCAYSKRNHNIDVHYRKRNRRKNSLCL